MNVLENEIIIEKLLNILDQTYNDGVFKEIPLILESRNDEIIIISLCIRGERDKNTPFYCGSMMTYVVKEYYFNNEVVWAKILHQDTINKTGG